MKDKGRVGDGLNMGTWGAELGVNEGHRGAAGSGNGTAGGGGDVTAEVAVVGEGF